MFDLNQINLDQEVVITNIRHKNLIDKAIESTKKAKETMKQTDANRHYCNFYKRHTRRFRKYYRRNSN